MTDAEKLGLVESIESVAWVELKRESPSYPNRNTLPWLDSIERCQRIRAFLEQPTIRKELEYSYGKIPAGAPKAPA